MLHANFTALCFGERELPIEVLHFGNRDVRALLRLWPWPWPDDLHIWTWPVSPQDVPSNQNELSTSMPSKVNVLRTDRQTDRQTCTLPTKLLPRRFVGCN